MEEIRERLAVLEQKEDNNNERIRNHALRIEKLEGNNDVLIRLSTLMEIQTDMNKKQNEQMERFGEVLNNVDSNLSLLNNSHRQLKVDMDDSHQQLKTDIDNIGSKVKDIEKYNEESKISVPKLITGIIIAIAMLSVGWIASQLGLK